jgi:hypothetical protein
LRLLGFLTIIKDLRSLKNDKQEGSLSSRWFKELGSAFYSAFIVLDNIAVLSKLRFLRINQDKIRNLSQICWFLGTICTAIYHSLILLALIVKEEHLKTRFLQHSHSIIVTDPAQVQSLVY